MHPAHDRVEGQRSGDPYLQVWGAWWYGCDKERHPIIVLYYERIALIGLFSSESGPIRRSSLTADCAHWITMKPVFLLLIFLRNFSKQAYQLVAAYSLQLRNFGYRKNRLFLLSQCQLIIGPLLGAHCSYFVIVSVFQLIIWQRLTANSSPFVRMKTIGYPVLCIRYVYPGSGFVHPESRIQGPTDSGSASKNLSIFNPKNCF